MRAVVAIALVGLVLGGLALGGCGGTTRLSKAEFVRRADAVCKDVQDELGRAVPAGSQDPTDPNTPDDVVRQEGQALTKTEATLRDHVAQLKKLHPPKDAQDGWNTYLKGTSTSIDRFIVLANRMAGGDRHAATEFDSLSQLSAKGDAWARSYGLKVCGAT